MRRNGEGSTHRSVFVDNASDGPWPCFFCGELCNAEIVHHLNEDRSDNRFENLVPAHDGFTVFLDQFIEKTVEIEGWILYMRGKEPSRSV